MNLCGFIADPALRHRLTSLAQRASWSCWLTDSTEALSHLVKAISPPPDLILSDDASAFDNLQTVCPGVYFGSTANAPDSTIPIALNITDAELQRRLKTCVNVRRFERQFQEFDRNEPITRLLRHTELLQQLQEMRGCAVGLAIIRIDHSEHLYANLDPVSKTDLLGSLSRHIEASLPPGTRLGFYDAACFVAVLEVANQVQLADICGELVHALRLPVTDRGGEIHVTASIGHCFERVLANAEHLWSKTWRAMTRASGDGGDRAHAEFTDELSERIPSALDRDEFSLALQPQWQIDGSTLSGVECLLRWQGMEVGQLLPEHFIPVAEQSGHMTRMGDWVLENACIQATTWLEQMLDPLVLSVNVSPQQFTNGVITKQIMRLAAEHWLNPSMLELELCHENMLHLVDQERGQLYRLRDMGVRFALDNLGSSLIDTNKLLRCPVDSFKLDRSLVAAMTQDPQSAGLAREICHLGSRFGLRVVGVGVEQPEQLELLKRYGCTDVQGYLLSPPIPIDEFHVLLRARLLVTESKNRA
ncbi:MAG: GGDEF domain-containing phosphodiesterase [Gammaproteobacteria bacterium]|nr:GGDEF domain-containing phosphodiesterase [Gammaproteobacteria bacterium]